MYYKGRAAAVLLILILAVYLVSVFSRGQEDDKYSILVVNNYMEGQAKEQLEKAVSACLGISEEQVSVDDSAQLDLSDGRKMAVSGGPEKITTEYFAHSLDVMIAPEDIVEYYSKLGGLKELSGLSKKNLSETESGGLWTEGKDGTNGIYALPVKGSSIEGISGDSSLYLCIFNNSGHQAQNEALLKSFCLENQENGE